MKRVKHIIGFLILSAIGFLFLHSELDFFTPQKHSHATHDFCDIVNNAKIENINTTLDKSKVLSINSDNILFNIPNLVSFASYKAIINPQIGKTKTKFSILYSTFLI